MAEIKDARPLPSPRGPIGEALAGHLERPPHAVRLPEGPAGDPLSDDDLHLALYACYELHYHSFDGVDPGWEWEPSLIAFRARLEEAFLARVLEEVPHRGTAEANGIDRTLRTLVAGDDGPQLSRVLASSGTADQFREFLVHRSAYHLKEADPQSWALPRLAGKAKAALVEIQADEYGGGIAERMHATMFGDMMEAVGLERAYGAYLHALPGTTLATVNLISLFGLHRRWRGACVGHLAVTEMTSSQPSRRYANAIRRLGFAPEATAFFDEHVEADAVHEVVAVHDMAGSLARESPEMAADILFGAETLMRLDATFAGHLLDAWARGESSLLEPLAVPAAA